MRTKTLVSVAIHDATIAKVSTTRSVTSVTVDTTCRHRPKHVLTSVLQLIPMTQRKTDASKMWLGI